MRIYTDVNDFSNGFEEKIIIALGNFDGVHLGHQRILKSLRDYAQKMNGKAAVLTFQAHPQSVLSPSKAPSLILSSRHKLSLFAESGVDICFFLPFTDAFSKQEASVFVEKNLVEKIRIRKIILGHDTHFGRGRTGNSDLVRYMAVRHGFDFEEAEPVKIGEETVSSTRIRELIKLGRLEEAEAFLGRPYSFLGQVVKGDGRGKTLGFPTANFDCLTHPLLIPGGVYPVIARQVVKKEGSHDSGIEYPVSYSNEKRYGVMNWGSRPTFQGISWVAEAHFFGVSENLYGQEYELCLYPRLREEKTFNSVEDLRWQIASDIDQGRNFFKKRGLDGPRPALA